jgi:hypothetical protein
MNFENLINESVIYLLINEYLSISDIKKVFFLNKRIYKNKSNRVYTKMLLEKNASNKITTLMKNYFMKMKIITHDNYDYLFNSRLITSRYSAFYYFKYYHKNYINSWYNNNLGWKEEIIKKYKKKHTNNPTRYDLFNLIKDLNPFDTMAIGW